MKKAAGSKKAVVLLGAQRFDPTLAAAVSELGIKGRIATITAGWQERESEDEELNAHLQNRTVNLKLHARGDEVFLEDTELRDAHRERQDVLRHRQDFYRIRLEYELECDRVIRQRNAPAEIMAEQAEAGNDTVRELDRAHLANCVMQHTAFNEGWRLHERPSVKKHRDELAEIIDDCDAIAIAGGHVATLINRLALFGIGPLCKGKTVFAWSGGAMAVSERVVLFHDDPPQGPGATEVLDAGLGLCPGAVFFPEPEKRLKLEQKDRMARLTRRFNPAQCLLLPARSRVTYRNGQYSNAQGVLRLRPTGDVALFEPEGGVQ
ncbi:MAG TPA: hypothetical protein VH083_25660 [Myxococcales bacterium]|nr:hypothetical protein [Myxococcales bacterium]